MRKMVFRKELYLNDLTIDNYTKLMGLLWANEIDGREVMIDKYGDGIIDNYYVDVDWCEDIK